MKHLILLFSLLSVSPAQGLTITSLNLEWYGRGGDMRGTPADEFRQASVKELVETHLDSTDLFIFQEIVDVSILALSLPGWDCRTYNPENLGHQHIVACALPGVIAKDKVLNDVRVASGLRPALQVDLNLANGKTLSVVGLHLKAGPDAAQVRLEQLQKLIEHTLKSGPMLVIGDFNSYLKQQTGLADDDAVLMDKLFKGAGFIQVGGEKETYLGDYRSTFDRAWEKDVKVLGHAVRGPCQAFGLEPPGKFTLESYYTRFVSDHCPFSVEVEN